MGLHIMEETVRKLAGPFRGKNKPTEDDYTRAKRIIDLTAGGDTKLYEHGIQLWIKLTGF